MNWTKITQVARNTFICAVVVGSLFVVGCSATLNGIGRDGKAICEDIIEVSQEAADKKMGDSIAWAIRDQNRIMRNGQQVAQGLQR